MGSCCSRDADSKTSWSPEETKNGSTASTVVAQPIGDDTTGTFKINSGGTMVATTTEETITTVTTATAEN